MTVGREVCGILNGHFWHNCQTNVQLIWHGEWKTKHALVLDPKLHLSQRSNLHERHKTNSGGIKHCLGLPVYPRLLPTRTARMPTAPLPAYRQASVEFHKGVGRSVRSNVPDLFSRIWFDFLYPLVYICQNSTITVEEAQRFIDGRKFGVEVEVLEFQLKHVQRSESI